MGGRRCVYNVREPSRQKRPSLRHWFVHEVALICMHTYADMPQNETLMFQGQLSHVETTMAKQAREQRSTMKGGGMALAPIHLAAVALLAILLGFVLGAAIM